MNSKQTWKIGDCLDLLPSIPDKSIDMILTDLPYSITVCKWDNIIPFEPLWKEYKRIIKNQGSIVLFSSGMFTHKLVMSNPDMYKYELTWKKSKCGSPLTAKYRPLKKHENIIVFGKGKNKYIPQMEIGKPYKRKWTPNKINNMQYGIKGVETNNNGTRFPSSILDFPQKWRRQDQLHPTQKPIELIEYLIKTYTNEGDWVHDSCLGSGTTLEACMATNRNCIGFEISDEWVPHYKKRLKIDNSKLTDF